MGKQRKIKALITGVSGFIGRHLVDACLRRDWEVIGIDIVDCEFEEDGFEFTRKDVRDLSSEDVSVCDYIFHLAFVTNIPNSINHPIETTRDNIDMSVYLLDLAAKSGVAKFVYPSTASLYGHNPTPWREEMRPYPIEPYSWQKLAVEQALEMWATCYGLRTVSLRLFQVFGENQRTDTALSAFFRAKREGRPILLTETTAQSSFRTGQRDFVYVGDVAEAFVLAAESTCVGNGEVLNVGSGHVTTMEEIANAVGGDLEFIPRRDFEVERHEADITNTTSLLGWRPAVEVIPWIKNYVPKI